MTPNEVWKPIPKWESLYEASSLGNIRRKKNQRVLKPNITYRGYYLVQLHNKPYRESWLVHRLVAITFLDNPDNREQINHKNGLKTDNRLDNLEWCTRSQNMRHARDMGLFIGQRQVNGKTIISQKLNGVEVGVFHSLRHAEAETGVSDSTICLCIKSKTPSSGGYIWERKSLVENEARTFS